MDSKMDPMGRAIADYWRTKWLPKVSITTIWQE